MTGLPIEPGPGTRVAFGHDEKLLDLPAAHRVLRLAIRFEQFGENPRELATVLPHATAVPPGVGDVPVTGPPEQLPLHHRGELLPGLGEDCPLLQPMFQFKRPAHPLEQVATPASQFFERPQQRDRPLGQREFGVRNQLLQVEVVPHPQSCAFNTHALGAVEAEQLGTGRFVAHATLGARVPRAEQPVDQHPAGRQGPLARSAATSTGLRSSPPPSTSPSGGAGRQFGCVACEFPLRSLLPPAGQGRVVGERPLFVALVGGDGSLLLHRDNQVPLTQLQSRGHRFGQSRPARSSRRQAVNYHFDGVPHVAVQLQVLIQRDHASIDPRPQVALLEQVGEEVAVLPFLPLHQRGEHQVPRPRRVLQQHRQDLLGGLRRDGAVALRTVPGADPCEQHPQIVINLGDRPHRAAGIPATGLLLDRDRRGEPADQIDLGLGHLPQELPGVARQRFDITPLSLGIQRVERE